MRKCKSLMYGSKNKNELDRIVVVINILNKNYLDMITEIEKPFTVTGREEPLWKNEHFEKTDFAKSVQECLNYGWGKLIKNMKEDFIKNEVGLWTGDELYQAINVGYKCIATIVKKNTENNDDNMKCEKIEITNVNQLIDVITTRELFIPRYIQYQDYIFMHIEKFKILSNIYYIDKLPKLTLKEVHTNFYIKGRMSKAIYDKLTKL